MMTVILKLWRKWNRASNYFPPLDFGGGVAVLLAAWCEARIVLVHNVGETVDGMPGDGALRCKGQKIIWLHGYLTSCYEKLLSGKVIRRLPGSHVPIADIRCHSQ